MKAKAIAYIRVSTQEQALEGISLDAQRERIQAYCLAHDITLIDVLADEGVSAAKPLKDRPQGSQLIGQLVADVAQIVIAVKLDRLFRDAVDCLKTVREWSEAGVALHLLDLGGSAFNSESALGRFFLTVMAGAAEMERNLISERTKAALAWKKANGQRVGQIPYGFRCVDGLLVEEPAEQAVIEGMRRDRRYKRLSIRKIAATYGLPKSTVHDILQRQSG